MNTHADGTALQQKLFKRRVGRVFMYLALTVSGAFTLAIPNDLITDQLPPITSHAWSIALMGSALGCLIGTLTDRWIGEFSALPLLFTTLALYGLGALFNDEQSLTVVVLGLITLSFSGGLVARWRDVQSIRSASLEMRDMRGTG